MGGQVIVHPGELEAGHLVDVRIHHLPIWRESALFSLRERAALAWTEVLTRLPEHGVPDDPVPPPGVAGATPGGASGTVAGPRGGGHVLGSGGVSGGLCGRVRRPRRGHDRIVDPAPARTWTTLTRLHRGARSQPGCVHLFASSNEA